MRSKAETAAKSVETANGRGRSTKSVPAKDKRTRGVATKRSPWSHSGAAGWKAMPASQAVNSMPSTALGMMGMASALPLKISA